MSLESERYNMSASLKDPKIGDRDLAVTLGSSFDSSTESRTSGVSSCDESYDINDNPCSRNTSGSLWRRRNRKIIGKSNWTKDTNANTEALDRELIVPPIRKLTINSTPEDDAMPKLEDLTLDSDCDSLTINKIAKLSLLSCDRKLLAGVVTSVAKVIGLIVAKPTIPHDVLLCLGSPVFLRESSTASGSKDVKLGWIIDVFGPACEPYYCVKPVSNGIELVREGTELFYSPDDSRTAFLCVKREDGNRYTVMYSHRDHRKVSGQPGEKDFWKNTSEGNSPRRQLYRRRYAAGNNRGNYYGYKNKYRDDFYSLDTIQPKHSYFDF